MEYLSRNMKAALILLLAFVVFTFAVGSIAVKTVYPTQVIDDRAVGPVTVSDAEPDDETCFRLGFSGVNVGFFNRFGYHASLEKLTKLLGYIALLTVAAFGAIGCLQLVRSRSLRGVDPEIIILGVFYVIVLAFYVVFEKLIVNYRPVIFDEGLEASYPSSHTMLVIAVMLTAPAQLSRLVPSKLVGRLAKPLCFVIIAVMIVGRLLSGVHWLTDIIGGVLLALSLVEFYEAARNAILGDEDDRPSSSGRGGAKRGKGGSHLPI